MDQRVSSKLPIDVTECKWYTEKHFIISASVWQDSNAETKRHRNLLVSGSITKSI